VFCFCRLGRCPSNLRQASFQGPETAICYNLDEIVVCLGTEKFLVLTTCYTVPIRVHTVKSVVGTLLIKASWHARSAVAHVLRMYRSVLDYSKAAREFQRTFVPKALRDENANQGKAQQNWASVGTPCDAKFASWDLDIKCAAVPLDRALLVEGESAEERVASCGQRV